MREALGFPVAHGGAFSPGHVASGLDLGCAVGRSSFEMARTCEQVTGIDFSHAFIGAADALRRGEALAYERLEEATLRTRLTAYPPAGVDAGRLHFVQGDAMNLPADIGSFDRVHAANLMCRLPDPARLLARLRVW